MKLSDLLAAVLAILLTTQARVSEDTSIQTPRGAKVNIKIDRQEGTNLPVVVVAPGQGCNWMGPIYETLASQGVSRA